MFLHPAIESDGENVIVPLQSFRTPNGSTLDPYDYSHPASAGWDGDRLHVYRNGDGQSAYAWKLAFDSGPEARQFADAYRELLRVRGARRVDGRTDVWQIPEGAPYADAFSVERTGDTVSIVNAPTVADLPAVHGDP